MPKTPENKDDQYPIYSTHSLQDVVIDFVINGCFSKQLLYQFHSEMANVFIVDRKEAN